MFPNPLVDSKFTFELKGAQAGIEVPLKVINMHGATVYEATFKSDQNGKISTIIQLDSTPGVYFVIVNAVTGLRQKVVVP